MTTPDNIEERHWLKNLREAQGFSLKEAGERCGIKKETYRDIESGKRFVKLKTLAKIARAFDFDVAQFGTAPPRIVTRPVKDPATKWQREVRNPIKLEFESELKIRRHWAETRRANEEMGHFRTMLKVTADGKVTGNYWENLRKANERLDREIKTEGSNNHEAVKNKTRKLSGNQKS